MLAVDFPKMVFFSGLLETQRTAKATCLGLDHETKAKLKFYHSRDVIPDYQQPYENFRLKVDAK